MTPAGLIKHYPLISDQIDAYELEIILRELQSVLRSQVIGQVVEFGCYGGTTSLFLQRILEGSRELHLYDSFEGLPEKSSEDTSPIGLQFQAGELRASKKKLLSHFKQANLPIPIIHKSWFSDLTSQDLPEQIAFAFLDSDYYESVLTSLELIWPRLTKGSLVIVDDYQNAQLPGAAKAVDGWLKTHPAALRVKSSLAMVRK